MRAWTLAFSSALILCGFVPCVPTFAFVASLLGCGLLLQLFAKARVPGAFLLGCSMPRGVRTNSSSSTVAATAMPLPLFATLVSFSFIAATGSAAARIVAPCGSEVPGVSARYWEDPASL